MKDLVCVVTLFASVLAMACAGNAPSPDSAPPNPAPVTFETRGGTRVHVIQTGWVAVKQSFRDLEGPESLRVLSIVSDGDWTEWFPILFYALERADGVVVLDTGETARIAEPGYTACDGPTAWFYENQMRFAVAPEDELGPQLRGLGLDPAEVKWAVLSHFHSDHMGGMFHLTSAEFLISTTDWGGHQGALLCRVPDWVEPTLVDYADSAIGAFARSHRVGGDADLRVVPTPGHSPGHQSLLLREGGRYTLFAGDAVFDLERAERGGLAGIAEDLDAARETVTTIQRQLRDFDTVLAPAHDVGVRDEQRFHHHRPQSGAATGTRGATSGVRE